MALDLLSLVAAERKAAIGFENDEVLLKERERSLEYIKGEMRDVPALPMRSKAVSTDVSDAIETLLPDLVEIFTGSDDVVAFTPVGEEDEEAAKQETDYINHVVFHENDGFMLLYAGMKDALSVKTGVWHWWWEDYRYQEETLEVDSEGLNALLVQQQSKALEIVKGEPAETEGQFKITVKRPDGGGKVCIKAVPPEDFAVAKDTVDLKDATYCCMRSFPRAQDLIADGYDEAKVNALPVYVVPDEQLERARDTAGEANETNDSPLRQVEIHQHIIRVVGDDKKPRLWRVVTDAQDTVELARDEISHINFSAVTPYPVAHRFYGRSVADLLLEIQRIRTSLTRMLLDCGYFALNQRSEVSETEASANTIADLLRNEPGVPVRSKTGNAVRPISAGALNFDVQGALEYTATMAEQRTGIIRNAQGLNPDTLHDTAKGAAQMLGQALKRTRLIARIFAETGIKDMFLGVHQTLSAHATKSAKVRLRNKWVEIDPTSWGSRQDMTIELGVGAGGKEHDILMLNQARDALAQVVEAQGGPSGPIVNIENVYNFAKRYLEKLGFKATEPFLTDPKTAPPAPPQPDPAVQQAQADMMLAREKNAQDLTLAREKMEMEDRLNRYKADLEANLRQQQFEYEAALNAQANAVSARRPETNIGPVRDGGAVG